MKTDAIEKYLQTAYSDERLAALLAHAEDGKLRYLSCCCLVGVANADHSLKTKICGDHSVSHYLAAMDFPFAYEAHKEFAGLGSDENRRRAVIPLIRAEMQRRENLKLTESAQPENEAVTV